MSVVRASGWVEFSGRVVVLKSFGGGPGNQAELFWFWNDEGFALGGCVNCFNIRLNVFLIPSNSFIKMVIHF